MAALRLCPRLLQRQIQKKTQQIRLMPSSGRIPQVQICCVLVQTIPPSFLESNQLFPFHMSSQSSPTQPLTGPPDPSSPVCAGVVTPQAIVSGQVLFSASLYVQCLTQLVILVMIWGVTNTHTAPVRRREVFKDRFRLLTSACPMWFSVSNNHTATNGFRSAPGSLFGSSVLCQKGFWSMVRNHMPNSNN